MNEGQDQLKFHPDIPVPSADRFDYQFGLIKTDGSFDLPTARVTKDDPPGIVD